MLIKLKKSLVCKILENTFKCSKSGSIVAEQTKHNLCKLL